ncbi:MAG: transposase [Oligoflexales bacterium]|nr:transposase [Oligoflexales bacterium]
MARHLYLWFYRRDRKNGTEQQERSPIERMARSRKNGRKEWHGATRTFAQKRKKGGTKSFDDTILNIHSATTMYPRRLIISNNSYAHVISRCHNKAMLLAPAEIKVTLLLLWAKYHSRYGIKIFDFIIMDNHFHMLVQAKSSELLGDFMRTVNSQLARHINAFFDRDSQALRERYKSPMITNARYVQNVQQYIWLNRYKVNKTHPDQDPFCSASWRLSLSSVLTHFEISAKERVLLSDLLTPYKHLPGYEFIQEKKYVRDILNAALSKLLELTREIFENSHTIGDNIDVIFRRGFLSAFRRTYIPCFSS